MKNRGSRYATLLFIALCAGSLSCGGGDDDHANEPPSNAAGSPSSSDPSSNPPSNPDSTADIAGTWLGWISVGLYDLRVVLNLEKNAEGGWTGTLDSPDQGALGIQLTSVELTGSHVTVTAESIGLVFDGDLSEDARSLDGHVQQAGESTPLALEKQAGRLDYRRPQDPEPPYPYNTTDVTFPSEAEGVSLAGTLVWPNGPGPFTTVVLITGSGPQNRNSEILDHRPFLVLADALARANIAVLRYDDRGVGQSTGEFDAATTADFALDVRGAVDFLRSQTDVPVGTIGLVGHSEGGEVAPMAADGNDEVGFLVLLAGPGVDGRTILLSQGRAIAAAQGTSAADLDAAEKVNRSLYDCFKAPTDTSATIRPCLQQTLASYGASASQISDAIAQLDTPWMRYFIPYDPAPVLRRTRIPVLALNGSLDLQVLPDLNLSAIDAALQDAGNDQATTTELPGLNHLFQDATTGLPSEYARIDETLSPEVLSTVADWIQATAPSSP